MASMSVSGVVSGMDWESMIESVLETAQKPAMVQVNKKTNLTNKKSLFEEMKVTMQSIQSSLSPLKLPSTYKAKEIEIERIDTNGSYKGVLTATVNADAEINVHELEVKQLATAQTNRSNQITSSTLKSTLGSLESSKLYINAGGQEIGIDVYATDSLESLKSRINNTLKTLSTPIAVTASIVDSKLVLKSDYTGLGTTTVEGTLKDNYNSSGRTSLSTLITNTDAGLETNLVINENFLDNLKVTSGGSSYTIHKDYEVVNNEIRWKQYEDTDNVKLGESVSAVYTMGADDVVEITAKRGSDDSDSVSLGFDVKDYGTLGTRMRIKAVETQTETETTEGLTTEPTESDLETVTGIDDDGNSFVKTFSYETVEDDDGGITYTLTAKTETEITKYYTYGTDFTYSNGKINWITNNDNTTNEPSSYTVSHTKDNSVNYTSEDITRSSDDDAFDITELNEYYNDITGSDFSTVTLTGSDGVIRTYIDPDDDYIDKLTITTDDEEYEYGRDFVLRVNDDGNGYVISWLVSNDVDGDGNYTAKDADVAVSAYTQYKGLSILNFKAAPDSGENYNLNFTYEKEDTTTTTVKSSDDDKSLETILGYALDESEYEDLVIKSGSKTYEYGYDFTINDDGEIEWIDITPKKPSEDVTFTINYKSGDIDLTSTDLNVNDDEDYSVFDDLLYDLDDDEMPSSFSRETISITDSEGTEYFYGRDFKINTDGTIKWLTSTASNSPDEDSEYTIIYDSFDSISSTMEFDEDNPDTMIKIQGSGYGNYSDGTGDYLSYEQVLTGLGLSTTASTKSVNVAFAKNFTLTDDDGNTYTYGTDFQITSGDDVDGVTGEHTLLITWLDGDDAKKPDDGAELTLTYGESGGETYTISDAVTRSNTDFVMSGLSGAPDYSEFEDGTVTITQGAKVFYQGIDFDIDTNDNGNTLINWKTGTDYEWYYPNPGQYSRYTVNLTTSDGTEKTFSGIRSYEDTLDLRNYGFTSVNGSVTSVTYGGTSYDLTSTNVDSDGNTDTQNVYSKLGLDINDGTNGGVKVFNFDWVAPALTSREGLPAYGEAVEISYEYYANTFSLTDDGDGLVDLLGLNDTSNVTEAQNAIIELNGVEIQKDLNDIGESYSNEISNLKGVTLHLKGTGKVSLDISHDAEKAVESIQTFVEDYNSLITWINTRMTESAVDEDTAATIDSDDFRMRWGLLHGDPLLRSTKTQMRDITSRNYTFSFTKRTSSEEVYGSMSFNGLKSDSTLRLRFNSTYVDVPILTTDTLQDIVDKINDSSNVFMHNAFYGDDGTLLAQPLLKASIEGDKLVISSTSDQEITMSGSAAMNALKMNYTYKGIYQLGIATTSDDYGKSGELEFDTDKFMEALENNPDEVQTLMLKFTSEMDSWLKTMLTTSASGETSGTLTRQIEDIESQISNIDEYLEKYQDRLDRMEESLRTKYAAAEQRISKLSQQASSIAAILNQLNGTANNSNSSS